jgi:hypothetical protein
MARLKYLFLMVSLTLSVTASAAWKVVVDPWTTAQVAANAASQQLIEDKHNERLDSIDSKQQKIMKYTAVMQPVTERYMKNIGRRRDHRQAKVRFRAQAHPKRAARDPDHPREFIHSADFFHTHRFPVSSVKRRL